MRIYTTLIAVIVLAAASSAQAGIIVNIGGTVSGFSPGTPEGTSKPGDPAVPVGAVNQLTLAAGDYRISNAIGQAGANPDYTAWRFDGGNDWVWNFVIADAATNQLLLLGYAGLENGSAVYGSQAEVASQKSVQDYSIIFSLAATTTLNFGVRDYYLPDNAGGVSLLIESASVPEPSSLALCGIAVLTGLVATRLRRERIRRSGLENH